MKENSDTRTTSECLNDVSRNRYCVYVVPPSTLWCHLTRDLHILLVVGPVTGRPTPEPRPTRTDTETVTTLINVLGVIRHHFHGGVSVKRIDVEARSGVEYRYKQRLTGREEKRDFRRFKGVSFEPL